MCIRDSPSEHPDRHPEPDVHHPEARRIESAQDQVRRELPAHVAAKGPVYLLGDVGRGAVPATRDKLAHREDDPVKIDQEEQREHRDDEGAERHGDVAERPEERERRRVQSARKGLL